MSVRVIVKRNTFYDSVVLMNASVRLREKPHITEALVVMGTESNKEILKDLGLLTDEALKAGADDLIVAFALRGDAEAQGLRLDVDALLEQEQEPPKGETEYSSLEGACEANPDANLAVISIPGSFAVREAEKSIERGVDTLLFTADVPLGEEARLKAKAAARGVLLMGPDCGVCNINGAALALASVVPRGVVGIAGASGSGIQEVSALVARDGLGVSHAIGTGGRDLTNDVGAATLLQAIGRLDADPDTQVMVLVVKRSSDQVTQRLQDALEDCQKPAVVCCLGDEPGRWARADILFASTMDMAARMATALVRGEVPQDRLFHLPDEEILGLVRKYREETGATGKYLRGVFGAGTFVAQAQQILSRLGIPVFSNVPFGGGKKIHNLSRSVENTLVDLGDEELTRGRAHPVIDPLPYRIRLLKEIGDPETAVVLFDLVLGPATHSEPADYMAAAIREAQERYGRRPVTVASVCGTEWDPQVLSCQERKLQEAGVFVLPSSAQAARFAALLVAEPEPEEALAILRSDGGDRVYQGGTRNGRDASGSRARSVRAGKGRRPAFGAALKVVNVGLESMGRALRIQGYPVAHVRWSPPAGGDTEVIELLDRLRAKRNLVERIEEANRRAYQIFVDGDPVWIDVAPAHQVIDGFKKNLVLHTGPRIPLDEMMPAHRDGILGGILYEGLASTREEAAELLRSGEILLEPGIDWGVPSGGMAPTTYSMPVVVAEDAKHGTRGFCPIQEGPSYRALRWGVYDEVVAERWRWFGESLGPALSRALKASGGLSLRTIIARSLQMGDENHSRETASSLMMISELASHLSTLGLPGSELSAIFEFLKPADRFALHVYIAGAASVLRAASGIPQSTVMVAMGGNGIEIGIKISGLGQEWFTAPAPLILGRYLNPSWTAEDTVPFSGDSCAVEVYGMGGLAAAASPVVAMLAGCTAEQALKRTQDMWKITLGKNANYPIPALGFQGTPVAVDMLKVLETGIVPQSHAGIIHKKGGQAGAGYALVPMECFRKAFLAFSKREGVE